MGFKLLTPIHNFLTATSFWRDNYFVWREFKHFRRIALLAVVFSLLSATFEGFGVGFLFAFLQGLLEPNAAPIHTGIGWFDLWILGVNAPVSERLYLINFDLLRIAIHPDFEQLIVSLMNPNC